MLRSTMEPEEKTRLIAALEEAIEFLRKDVTDESEETRKARQRRKTNRGKGGAENKGTEKEDAEGE